MKQEHQGTILRSGPELQMATQPSSHTATIRCPECGSQNAWKDGMRFTPWGEIQRYLCRNCNYRFSASVYSEFSEQLQRLQRLILKSGAPIASTRNRHGDASDTGKAALTSTTVPRPKIRREPYNQYEAVNDMEARTQEKAAGETETQPLDIKGKIIEYLWWMEKQGYAQQTIRGAGSALRALITRGANLADPETVKEALAREKAWSPARRRNVINAYTIFLKFSGLKWEKPKCKVPQTIPFIPKEEELDALIAGSGKKNAAFQQVMKETAMRPGEVDRLLWTDIDEERHLIRINNPEKGSNSGVYKVSQKLIDMLRILPRENIKVFRGISQRARRTTFERTRKRLAQKLGNPRLLQISFATYRHWKATMLQHQTKDPWYVKSFLRHRCIANTEKYINVERAIFGEGADSDQFTAKVATNQDEITQLIETGFEYVLQKDSLAYFRKRK